MADKFKVLMVEDDDGDARLAREAILEAKLDLELDVVEDGLLALEYLHGRGAYAGKSRPDLLLLDLNLPKLNGHEVLRAVKGDPRLRHIPVVVLTTSDAERDLAESYAQGANCYVTKPVGFEKLSHVVKAIGSFWFTIVRLPKTAARL